MVFNHQASVWRAQIVTRTSRFSGLLSCLLEICQKEPDGGWAGCGLHYYRESHFTNCNQLKMEGIIIVGNCLEQSDHPHSEGKLEIACSVFSTSELTRKHIKVKTRDNLRTSSLRPPLQNNLTNSLGKQQHFSCQLCSSCQCQL